MSQWGKGLNTVGLMPQVTQLGSGEAQIRTHIYLYSQQVGLLFLSLIIHSWSTIFVVESLKLVDDRLRDFLAFLTVFLGEEEEDEEEEEEEEQDKEGEGGGEEEGGDEGGREGEENEEEEEYEEEDNEEEEDDDSFEEEDENYMDKEEEETDTPEGRVLDAITDFKLGYFFCHLLVLKSTLFFTKEATEYQYENSDEEAQKAGGEEKEVDEDENEEPEERKWIWTQQRAAV
ncbi:uncharacterized protein [Callorhinus ursinus]|uniref:uncharacterized protein n=1 Tax=Callorhinus ursinus TaxID=34884 RepID=UPI003CD04D9C